MRVPLLIALAVVILGSFLLVMMTYTVPFTGAAVVTTFGKADEGAVVTEAGLRMKWPAPIQSETVYDTRVRLLRTVGETQQTADQRQLIVRAFLTWRVADPLEFNKGFRAGAGSDARDHYREAERSLESLFRSAMSEVSRFRLDELFVPAPGRSRLPDLERAVLERLNAPSETGRGGVADLGIEVTLVGINGVELPESATREVFEQMSATREKLAADAESQGEALAQSIRSEADAARQKILAFANTRASEIINRGELEAAEWIRLQAVAPELAIFLKHVELLQRGFGTKVTWIVDPGMPGFQLFGPEALGELGLTSPRPEPTEARAGGAD